MRIQNQTPELLGAPHDLPVLEEVMQFNPSVQKLLTSILLVALVLVLPSLLGILLDLVLGLPALHVGQSAMLGLVLILLGISLEAVSIHALWHLGGGTPNPGSPTQRLVTGGPYRYSRNPPYVARILILLGISLFLGSAGVLLMTVFLIVGIHFVPLPREERRLEERYDRHYLEYTSNFPRWLLLNLKYQRPENGHRPNEERR